MSSGRPIIALCGPSMVGKEFTKDQIKHAYPFLPITEPMVATTRPQRPTEAGSRAAGLSEEQFNAGTAAGDICLPHRPFRAEGTPWYGFVTSSFDAGTEQLTEVHSTVIEPFREVTGDRPVLMIGLIASRDTLELNLDRRLRRDGVSDEDAALRLKLARTEVTEIMEAHNAGHIDWIFRVDEDSAAMTETIIHLAGSLYGR